MHSCVVYVLLAYLNNKIRLFTSCFECDAVFLGTPRLKHYPKYHCLRCFRKQGKQPQTLQSYDVTKSSPGTNFDKLDKIVTVYRLSKVRSRVHNEI